MPTTEPQKPPRVKPRLKAAPKIRQLYWCDFPEDAHLPEFWKCRPVVVVSYKNTLSGAVTVVPCSTKDQSDGKWVYSLETTIDNQASWAICNNVTTLAVSRLSIDKAGIKRLQEDEFNGVLEKILEWLPKPSKN